MTHNSHENFTRQPYQFGSIPPQQASDKNTKKLIISGNLEIVTEKVKAILDKLGLSTYKYLEVSNTEGAYLLSLANYNMAKDAIKTISDQLKADQIENVTVKFYEPKDERNVYVKNLPLHYTEKELTQLFQSFGSIISKKIIKKTANSNSIGFVRYTTKDEAEKAILEINSQRLNLLGNDRSVRCEFSKTSNPSSNYDSQRTSHNYYPSNPVPRFQNFQSPNMTPVSSQYQQNNMYFHPYLEYQQLVSQLSNMSLSSNNMYFQGYGPNNAPILIPYTGNYPGPYPYMVYPGNNQTFNYHQNNS